MKWFLCQAGQKNSPLCVGQEPWLTAHTLGSVLKAVGSGSGSAPSLPHPTLLLLSLLWLLRVCPREAGDGGVGVGGGGELQRDGGGLVRPSGLLIKDGEVGCTEQARRGPSDLWL